MLKVGAHLGCLCLSFLLKFFSTSSPMRNVTESHFSFELFLCAASWANEKYLFGKATHLPEK